MFRVRVEQSKPQSNTVTRLLAKAQGFKTTIDRPAQEDSPSTSVKTTRRKPKQGQREKSDLVQFFEAAFDSDDEDDAFTLEGFDVDKLYSEAMKELKSVK